MRLLTCFILYAVVSVINTSHSGQPYAAVWKPDLRQCSHCPAKSCPSAKKIAAKKTCDQHLILTGGRVPKPIIQNDYEMFLWNNKVRMLLN
jgi:hypothetical protein